MSNVIHDDFSEKLAKIKSNLLEVAENCIDGMIESHSLAGMIQWTDTQGTIIAACGMFIGETAARGACDVLENYISSVDKAQKAQKEATKNAGETTND